MLLEVGAESPLHRAPRRRFATYNLNGGFKPTLKRFADLDGPDFFPTPAWATHALIDCHGYPRLGRNAAGDPRGFPRSVVMGLMYDMLRMSGKDADDINARYSRELATLTADSWRSQR